MTMTQEVAPLPSNSKTAETIGFDPAIGRKLPHMTH
jgi:hypothetical protein